MLNQNYSESVFVDTAAMDWEASPAAGVWRKKLERENAESGRATSLVRYEAGSSFKPHEHNGGEEILVLDGVFSDEKGDYPAGCYFRNPPGSSHTPSSEPGCTLFVKLCYFQPGDTQQRVVSESDRHWQQEHAAGEMSCLLHQFGNESTSMVKLAANTPLQCAPSQLGREVLILDGALIVKQARFSKFDWLRFSPSDSQIVRSGEQGATLLCKTGHLSQRGDKHEVRQND